MIISEQNIVVDSSVSRFYSNVPSSPNTYSNLFRSIAETDDLTFRINSNKFEIFEFYYDHFLMNPKSPKNNPTGQISVTIRENNKSIPVLPSTGLEQEQQKISINISPYKNKNIEISIRIKNDGVFGTDLYGFFFYIPKANPTRIILISLDTVGSEHLGFYGYNKFETTPELKKFIESDDSIFLFKNAYGQSWWTLPAHATIFTGLYAAQHNLNRTDLNIELDKNIKTLDQILQEKGIYVYHSISHNRLRSEYGFNKGAILLTDYSALPDGEKADNIIDNALSILKSNMDKDIFMFLHFFDAHAPYSEYPQNYKDLSPDINPMFDSSLIDLIRVNFPNWYNPENRLSIKNLKYDALKTQIDRNERAYDLGIRLLDHKISHLFEQLRDLGIWNDIMFVITGDHGEEFFEHGGLTHTSLYNYNIKVPFIIKLRSSCAKPGENLNRVLSRNIEAHQTLLTAIQELFENGNVIPPAVYKNWNQEAISELFPDYGAIGQTTDRYRIYQTALIGEQYKLIATSYRDIESSRIISRYDELYDLKSDPREQINIANTQSGRKILNQMKKSLSRRLKSIQKIKYVPIFKGDLDKEQIKKLKSLGYINSRIGQST